MNTRYGHVKLTCYLWRIIKFKFSLGVYLTVVLKFKCMTYNIPWQSIKYCLIAFRPYTSNNDIPWGCNSEMWFVLVFFYIFNMAFRAISLSFSFVILESHSFLLLCQNNFRMIFSTAGDAGHTEYEAEIQYLSSYVSVYANNVNRTDCRAQEMYRYSDARVFFQFKLGFIYCDKSEFIMYSFTV